jgi:hypothetical protein
MILTGNLNNLDIKGKINISEDKFENYSLSKTIEEEERNLKEKILPLIITEFLKGKQKFIKNFIELILKEIKEEKHKAK